MHKHIFGTDGVRGPLGTPPFTSHGVHALGYAIGAWAVSTYGAGARLLLIHDTRISYAWVKATLESGLLLHPLTIVDASILPTPAALALMQDKAIPCGIVISASHNPYHDNGIKIIGSTGKISDHDEQIISELFRATHTPSYNHFGTIEPWTDAAEIYQTLVLKHFHPPFLKSKTVVLDCAHGATSMVAPAIFEQAGARVIAINNQPNGTNINDACGALHTTGLQKAVIEHQANIGFAFDGDGDRVIAVNNHGIVKDGDDILALLANHKRYQSAPTIVGTTMSNQGFTSFLAQRNKHLIRAQVGDKYVAHELLTHNLPLGGEQSGHIICRDYLPTGDGIFTALRLLETIIKTNNWGLETFERYPQILLSVPVKTKQPLTDEPLAKTIAHHEVQLKTGRLVVRYSGTEPLLRIMVEAKTHDEAHSIAHTLSKELLALLG